MIITFTLKLKLGKKIKFISGKLFFINEQINNYLLRYIVCYAFKFLTEKNQQATLLCRVGLHLKTYMGFHGYISINNDFRIIFQEAEVLNLYMDKQIRIAEKYKTEFSKSIRVHF